jgi:ribosomal protein L11 methylase PrmA
VSAALLPDQAEIVVDPGQAFGTGGHPSTHLALDWIDELAPTLKSGARSRADRNGDSWSALLTTR